MNKDVYLGDLWCYIHIVQGVNDNLWFEKEHRDVYGGVIPSWPDEMWDEAQDENCARDLDALAAEMDFGVMMLPVINGHVYMLVVGPCVACDAVTLINIEMQCFRCGQALHK